MDTEHFDTKCMEPDCGSVFHEGEDGHGADVCFDCGGYATEVPA